MQDLLVEMLGESGATVARYVIAIAVIVLLLVVLRWALQRYRGGSGMGHRSRQPRLAVMDVAPVDARRRLVLIRRDNVEHLILIGGPTDIVVEQTIIKGVPVGTLGGRVPPRAGLPAPGPAPAPAATPAAEAPAPEREPTASPVGMVTATAGLAGAGLAAAATEPTVVAPRPVRPLPADRSAGPSAPPAPQAPVARAGEPRVEPDLKPVRQGPYVPPEPTRPAPHPEAIAPIVAAVEAPKADAAPAQSTVPAEVPVIAERRMAPPDADADYDDLARRLDEALRVDLAQSRPDAARTEPVRPDPGAQPAAYTRPIRGPAARTETPEVAPDLPDTAAAASENVVELPPRSGQRPAPSPARAAGAWFRPRAPKPVEEPAPEGRVSAAPEESAGSNPGRDAESAGPRDIEITLQSEPLIDTGPQEVPKAGSRLVPDDRAPAPRSPAPEVRPQGLGRAEPAAAARGPAAAAPSATLPLRASPGPEGAGRPGPAAPVREEAPSVSGLKPPMTAIETVDEPEKPVEAAPEQASDTPTAGDPPAAVRVDLPIFVHPDDDAIDADTMPAASATDKSAAAAPAAPEVTLAEEPDEERTPSTAPDVSPAADRREPDFSSLEDEMARLLDELAGDVRKDRR